MVFADISCRCSQADWQAGMDKTYHLSLSVFHAVFLFMLSFFVIFIFFQESKGYEFESETDTETIAKLVKYMYDNRESDDISFATLVERVTQQLVSFYHRSCGVSCHEGQKSALLC